MTCSAPLFRIDIEKQPGLAARCTNVLGLIPVNGGIIGSGQIFASAGIDLLRLTPLPCGQCIACRINYSRSWAVRMMCEAEYHPHNYFITLTYSDSFLPRDKCYDLSDHKLKDSNLQPKHLSSFMKRLRENIRREYGVTGVKFFAAGEFGELMDRPHYHACLFGMPDLSSDLTFLKQNGSVIHFTHDLIGDSWCDPDSGINIGFHSISEFNFETAAYTGAYMTKKIKGLANKIEAADPELLAECDGNIRFNAFARMSNRPGLGYQYFKDHSFDILRTDSIPYQKDHKAFLAKSPRYFDKLFDYIDPNILDTNRELRTTLGNARFTCMSNNDRLRYHSQAGVAAKLNQETRGQL